MVAKEFCLHVGEDVVQLRSRADVVQKHVVHIWSEVLLRDGVVLQRTTTTDTSVKNHRGTQMTRRQVRRDAVEKLHKV